ncbi:MAG: hypothetical protein HYX47_13760 [Burkholderiales bacterium]|nr:hypothetical protein [Burkholderiales bacterium]
MKAAFTVSVLLAMSMAAFALPCSVSKAELVEGGVRVAFAPKTDWLLLNDGGGNSGLVGDGLVYRLSREGVDVGETPEPEAGFLLRRGRTLKLSTHHQGCELSLEMREGRAYLRGDHELSMPYGSPGERNRTSSEFVPL